MVKKLSDNFCWVGSLDPGLRIFDAIMETGYGTSYNSFLLRGGEKNVLFETTKATFTDEYIENLSGIIDIADIDVLVLSHMEPDHSGAAEKLLELNPDIEVYATKSGLHLVKEIVNREFTGVAVADGDVLDVGGATLRFMAAPNLHWPDTMFTYIPEEKALVTCDAFGAHFSYEGVVYDDGLDKETYTREARHYFDCIMSPFKADVLKALDKIAGLDIEVVATGHGPVLKGEGLSMIGNYRSWAGEPERAAKKTVVIPYISAYGYTQELAEKIAEGVRAAGDLDVKLFDMTYEDIDGVMKEIDLADGFLLGTPTIVGEALPPILDIASRLNARVHGGRFAGAFGSYGWSGEGAPHVLARLSQLKLKLFEEAFRVRFKPSEEDLARAHEYGKAFGAAVLEGALPE